MSPSTLLIAISGPSCSGKTTLARLLRDALSPHAFILHEDDFYKTDAEVPYVTIGDGRRLQDWDCLESLDLDAMERMLKFVKSEGRLDPSFESKEDQNSVGSVALDDVRVQEIRRAVRGVLEERPSDEVPRIAIVDGFLLFANDMHRIRALFDVKLLLTTDYATIKQRREGRTGYVTLEGFWEDPPGYVDAIVWPNFVKDHKFLYKAGKVEDGVVDDEVCKELGIECMPKEAGEDMTGLFEWAVGVISDALLATAGK